MISVIVPIYNTEKYLSCCINSILSQTYTNFELLLVDDGSTDESSIICDEYALKDSRVRVFHKENGGVTSARRFGVQTARGEWVTFVDSDDELHIDALQILSEYFSNEMIDVVASDLKWDGCISGEEYVKKTLKGELYNRVWGNAYRRTVLTNWVFDLPRSINVGEDMLMNVRIGLSMKGYAKCIKDGIYMYRHNHESVLNTWKITLEYEEMLIRKLVETLGYRKADFLPEYYFSNLNILESLIVCKVPVDYNRPWVVELKNWYKRRRVSWRHWIVLNISHNLLCKYILAIEKRIIKVC